MNNRNAEDVMVDLWGNNRPRGAPNPPGAVERVVELPNVPNTVGPRPFRPPLTNWHPIVDSIESVEAHKYVNLAVGSLHVPAFVFVLQAKAPVLAELVTDVKPLGVFEIIGKDDPELFKLMIRILYTGYDRTKFTLESHGMPLLKLANRFGRTELKMHLEADIAENGTMLSVEKAVDMLFFADANACAYLKEQALDKIISVGHLNQASETQLQESTELMAEVSAHRRLRNGPNNVESWVAKLRQRLADRGLDTDGTRQMLINRWDRSCYFFHAMNNRNAEDVMVDLWGNNRPRYAWTCDVCSVEYDPMPQCPSCGAPNPPGAVELPNAPNTIGPRPFRPHLTNWHPIVDSIESVEAHKYVNLAVGSLHVPAFVFVLQAKAPVLAELVADVKPLGVFEIIGEDDPELFKLMIRFLYKGYDRTKFTLESQGMPLLKLANRFGCTELKMHLEADIAENSTMLSVEKAVDMLFFADANACAYLKEQAIRKIVTMGRLNQASESQLQEYPALMAEVSAQRRLRNPNDVQSWVAELRQRLADRGLDTDGTHQMLTDRLRAHAF